MFFVGVRICEFGESLCLNSFSNIDQYANAVCIFVCVYVKCECARVSACECFLWFICNSFSYSLYVRSMFWKKNAAKKCVQFIANESSGKRESHYCIALHRSPPKLSLAETTFALLHLLFSRARSLARSLSHSTLDAYVELFALVG